ncbi:MAG: oligosaccharide flippase family protein, partial [Micromonosporaceae bacterium]|nr:oligosaccharide flippase family protein [Micromonosporaceae bacterium]
LSGAAVTGVLVLVLARVPLRLGLDRAVAAKLLRFGLPLAASLGIEAVLMNADYVIVGRLLGVVPLGYYLLAFNTSSWAVSLLGTAVRYVSLPAFSRLSDQEMDSLSSGVRRAMTLLITAVAPVVVIMSVLAPELVAVLFGDRWLPAAPVLRYLMILTVVRLFTSLTLDALTGAGVTRVVLWVNLAWAVALVPALYAGTRLAGIVGTALAHAAAGLLVAVPFAVLALLRVGVRLGPLPRTLVRPVAAGFLAAAVAVVTRLLVGGSPLLGLCAAGGASVLCYAATAVPRAQLRDWLGRSQTSTDFGEASYDRPNRMDGSDARTIGDDQSAGRL